MKKVIILLISIIAFTACKNDSKKKTEKENLPQATKDKTAKQNDGLITIQGDYIFYKDAAVLQTRSEIYGIILNDLANQLNIKSEELQKDQTDMAVTIRCKKSKKPENEEGWKYRLEIKEILKVEAVPTKDNDVIKLGS